MPIFCKRFVFISRLCAGEPPFPCWHDARHEFEAFVTELRQHEASENAIVQAAFGDDVGTAD